MNFSKTGSLIGWSLEETVIIPDIKEVSAGKFRGGAFLCIPNFEYLPFPFDIKHGEYRTGPCAPTLPHTKLLSPSFGGDWGKISTKVIWEERSLHGMEQLEVKAYIDVISQTAMLRPGFHPYFKVDKDFIINVGAVTLTRENIPHDRPMNFIVHKNKSGSAIATFQTGKTSVSIAATMEDWPLESNTHFSFCIWSDNPDEYICIEPVYGISHGVNNLPTPFTLNKGQSVTVVSKIIVSKI